MRLLPLAVAAWLRGPAAPAAPACPVPQDLQGWSLLAVDGHALVLSREPEDADELGLVLYDCQHKKRLLFLHIPKNAGTTIENVAATTGVAWGAQVPGSLDNRRKMPDGNLCNDWHVPPKYLPSPNAYTNADVFCVTRSPLDRALSEYRYLLSVPWGKNAEGLYAKPACTPEGLNHFLQAALGKVAGGASFINDCHFLPQTEFVWGPHRQWCTNVIRIDQLPHAFNDLMAARGLRVRLGAEKKNSHAGTCPGLSTASFWPATTALIHQVYAEDFAKLGY